MVKNKVKKGIIFLMTGRIWTVNSGLFIFFIYTLNISPINQHKYPNIKSLITSWCKTLNINRKIYDKFNVIKY